MDIYDIIITNIYYLWKDLTYMKKKKHRSILVLSLLVLLSVYICYAYKPIIARIKLNKDSVSITITDTNLPAPTSLDNTNQAPVLPNTSIAIAQNLDTQSILLPVANISQLPELPTGCEITSLTIVLNYLGYNVDKEDMARDYLEKSEPFKGSFNDYFIGSPWDDDAWGCYAPVITKSANNFLKDHNSKLIAYNTTGSSMEELCVQIASGNPVIVWTSQALDEKTITTTITLENGTNDYWYSDEHCVVIIGYDLQKGTLTVCDPLEGIVERDFNTFNSRYEEFQQMGVVIK